MGKVLITGVAGLTGSHLVRKCLAEGETVVGVDNYFRGVQENIEELFGQARFTFYKQDFRDFIAENSAAGFDEIYHLAAIVPTKYFYEAPELTYEVNCEGTHRIFKWALAGGVKRFVNASSSEIYGHPQEFPIKETTPSHYDAVEVSPRWSYAHGKILTEYFLNKYKDDIQLCHLRYANVYGPYDVDDHHVLPYILRCLLENRPVQLNRDAGSIMRSFLYMSDCADATYLAMKHMHSGTSYNIGNPEEVTIQQLFDTAREVVQQQFGIQYTQTPDYSLQRAGDPTRRVLDISRAADHLGYQPKVMLREGLQRTAQWMLKPQR